MIVPMIDQALAQARAMIGAQGGVAPPERKTYSDRGRSFSRVAAAEWRRLLNEALPRVNLLLLTEGEALADAALTVTFTLTHILCGDTRTITRVEPLGPAPSRALAKQWAHTKAVNSVARTLLWQWDDEDEAQDEPGQEAPAEKPHARRNGNGAHLPDRSERGARTPRKAVAAAAALAHATLVGAPIVAEIGDEEREEEARQHAEAARLLAAGPKRDPLPDPPGLMDDETPEEASAPSRAADSTAPSTLPGAVPNKPDVPSADAGACTASASDSKADEIDRALVAAVEAARALPDSFPPVPVTDDERAEFARLTDDGAPLPPLASSSTPLAPEDTDASGAGGGSDEWSDADPLALVGKPAPSAPLVAGPADLRGMKRAERLRSMNARPVVLETVKRSGGSCAIGCGVKFNKGDEVEIRGGRRAHVKCPPKGEA